MKISDNKLQTHARSVFWKVRSLGCLRLKHSFVLEAKGESEIWQGGGPQSGNDPERELFPFVCGDSDA